MQLTDRAIGAYCPMVPHAPPMSNQRKPEPALVLADHHGTTWGLYQDGDLWEVPEGYEWEAGK